LSEEVEHLREALNRTRDCLEQERRLNASIKQKKVSNNPSRSQTFSVLLSLIGCCF